VLFFPKTYDLPTYYLHSNLSSTRNVANNTSPQPIQGEEHLSSKDSLPALNPSAPAPRQESSSVAVSAAVIAMGTMTSRILGLVRDMVLAALFPIMVKDAWVVAFRLPNLFRRLLGEGSLSVAFIPVFVEVLTQNKSLKAPNTEAQKLIHGVFTLLFAILCLLTTLGTLWIEPLLRLIVSGEGYMSVPGKFELTVTLGRIMFGFIFLMSAYAFFMAILNSLKQFALPAMAPAILNMAIIVSTILSTQWPENPGIVVSIGVMIGGFLQMAVLLPPLYKMGYLPKLTFKVNNPQVRRVLRSIVPSLLGMGILQLTGLINIQFASRLPQGSHSWIYFADRILELPLSLFAVSLGSALLPTLASFWSSGDVERMGKTANHYLRLIFYVTIPAAVGIYILAVPIIEVLFLRGHFTSHDVQQTASVLRAYALVLILTSCVRIMTTSFYATKNTWLPAAAATIGLICHFFMATLLIETIGLAGLPLATAFSSAVNVGLLFLAYRWLIGPLHFQRLIRSLIKFCIAAAIMSFATNSYWLVIDSLGATNSLTRGLSLSLSIILSLITYAMASHLLRIEEYQVTVHAYWSRIQSKLLLLKTK
jgi:putative peptidoglycan lipid II flippase